MAKTLNTYLLFGEFKEARETVSIGRMSKLVRFVFDVGVKGGGPECFHYWVG